MPRKCDEENCQYYEVGLGDRVSHPIHGEGSIAVVSGDHTFMVRFDGYIETVNCSEVAPVGETSLRHPSPFDDAIIVEAEQ